jgi:cold shock CspA family protein
MDKQPLTRYDSAKGGMGMITAHLDGQEIFFRVRSVEEGGPVIKVGQQVSYEVQLGPDGQYYAVNLEVIDGEED